MEQKVYKKYVQVTAEFTPEGKLIPLCVDWDNGIRFPIDRVKCCERAASRKAGGVGLRYTCMIRGQEATCTTRRITNGLWKQSANRKLMPNEGRNRLICLAG